MNMDDLIKIIEDRWEVNQNIIDHSNDEDEIQELEIEYRVLSDLLDYRDVNK